MRRKMPGSAAAQLDVQKGENCGEAFALHHGQRKSPAGGRRHDRAESVETPRRLAHRLRASYPDSRELKHTRF